MKGKKTFRSMALTALLVIIAMTAISCEEQLPPGKPEVTAKYYPMYGVYTAHASDPNGDKLCYEWEIAYGDGDPIWIPVTPDEEGGIAFSEMGILKVRVRAIDTKGLCGPWETVQGEAFRKAYFTQLFPSIWDYYDDGTAKVNLILSAYGGGNEEQSIYRWRYYGDEGEGERFYPGPGDAITDPDGNLQVRGIILETGKVHRVEICIEYLGNKSDWEYLEISIPEEHAAFLRPCIFSYERPLFKTAVKVVTEVGIPASECNAIREKYGKDNLIDNLGLKRTEDSDPIWAYMDEDKVLHIQTTAQKIIPGNIRRMVSSVVNDQRPWMMESMFAALREAVTIDLSNMDLSAVAFASNLFADCRKLERVIWPEGMEKWNMCNLDGMFKGCTSLRENPIKALPIGAADLDFMFRDCVSLTALDLSGWNMDGVYRMEFMLAGCVNLKTLKLPERMEDTRMFNASFENCVSLTDADFGGLTVDGGTTPMMFYNCRKLKTINCDKNIHNISGAWMFMGCSSLEKLDLSNVDLSDKDEKDRTDNNFRYLASTFEGCEKLAMGTVVDGKKSEKGLFLSDSFKESRLPGYDEKAGPDAEANARKIVWKKDMFKDCPLIDEATKEEYMNIGASTGASRKPDPMLDETWKGPEKIGTYEPEKLNNGKTWNDVWDDICVKM